MGSNKDVKMYWMPESVFWWLLSLTCQISQYVSPFYSPLYPNASQELLLLILSFDHLGTIRSRHWSWISIRAGFNDISLNLDFMVSYNRLPSSWLFTPVGRLSTYMSLWMLHSPV